MVVFKNITFDDEWIYATAEDYTDKKVVTVKLHRHKEYYECSDETFDLLRALWALQRRVNTGKIKQHSQTAIAWG